RVRAPAPRPSIPGPSPDPRGCRETRHIPRAEPMRAGPVPDRQTRLPPNAPPATDGHRAVVRRNNGAPAPLRATGAASAARAERPPGSMARPRSCLVRQPEGAGDDVALDLVRSAIDAGDARIEMMPEDILHGRAFRLGSLLGEGGGLRAGRLDQQFGKALLQFRSLDL